MRELTASPRVSAYGMPSTRPLLAHQRGAAAGRILGGLRDAEGLRHRMDGLSQHKPHGPFSILPGGAGLERG
jgi:hypothetical protein